MSLPLWFLSTLILSILGVSLGAFVAVLRSKAVSKARAENELSAIYLTKLAPVTSAVEKLQLQPPEHRLQKPIVEAAELLLEWSEAPLCVPRSNDQHLFVFEASKPVVHQVEVFLGVLEKKPDRYDDVRRVELSALASMVLGEWARLEDQAAENGLFVEKRIRIDGGL